MNNPLSHIYLFSYSTTASIPFLFKKLLGLLVLVSAAGWGAGLLLFTGSDFSLGLTALAGWTGLSSSLEGVEGSRLEIFSLSLKGIDLL